LRIIDTHLHLKHHENFDRLCRGSGHHNSLPHLLESMDRLGIAGCVVMGSSGGSGEDPCRPGLFDLGGPVDLSEYHYPRRVAFCAGVEPAGLAPECRAKTLAAFDKAADCPGCVGFKIYLGYRPYYADDPLYHPIYELAVERDLTVVFHTGDTAHAGGRLRYSHPLTVDEVAVRYPDLRIVLAHFGNPWLVDAAEVVKNNPNVYADLSGLAVGIPDTQTFRADYAGYISQLETWLGYLDRWDHLLYGSDWPLVNLEAYLRLIASVVPARHHDLVFYQNALAAFPRLGGLLAPRR
jgi:predicted TIM-barrel fold metal-dependent hydrolase